MPNSPDMTLDNGELVTLADLLAQEAQAYYGSTAPEIDGDGGDVLYFEVQGFHARYTVTLERQRPEASPLWPGHSRDLDQESTA